MLLLRFGPGTAHTQGSAMHCCLPQLQLQPRLVWGLGFRVQGLAQSSHTTTTRYWNDLELRMFPLMLTAPNRDYTRGYYNREGLLV